MMTLRMIKGLIAVSILTACSSGSGSSPDAAGPKPEILTFAASETKVKVMTEVALSWQSRNAENCLLKNEANSVLAEGQSGRTNLTIKTTENFTLWCHNASQSVQAKLMISVTSQSGQRIVSQDLSSQPSLWNLDYIDGEMDGFFRSVGSGQGVRVYVIDTGIFGDHPEFEGRVLEGGNPFGRMMEGTGDVGYPKKGWLDTIRGPSSPRIATSTPPFYNDHGTHVAGIVAGKTFGIAKDATIIPVRMSDGAGIFDDEEKLLASRRVLLESLKFVLANEKRFASGRAVVNVSMAVARYMKVDGEWKDLAQYVIDHSPDGFVDEMDSEYEAVARSILAKDIPIFVAAGNTGCSFYPGVDWAILQNLAAKLPGLVTVGNLELNTEIDELHALNTSLLPAFWAPGTKVRSASGGFADGVVQYGHKVDTGTSMASPILAGLAAILLERSPGLSAADIESALRSNASTRKRLDHKGHGTCGAIENTDVFMPFLGRP